MTHCITVHRRGRPRPASPLVPAPHTGAHRVATGSASTGSAGTGSASTGSASTDSARTGSAGSSRITLMLMAVALVATLSHVPLDRLQASAETGTAKGAVAEAVQGTGMGATCTSARTACPGLQWFAPDAAAPDIDSLRSAVDGTSKVDSPRVVQHPPVVVTASRIPLLLETAPAAVEVFDAASFAHAPVWSVADVLTDAAGAGVRMYGAQGSLASVSMRGLGPEYTVVLVNGVRVNDAQNGLVDLGRFALQQVERIEVARGGFAAMYGTDALGGVVNILTDAAHPHTGLRAGAGSFGWRMLELDAGVQGEAGRLQLGAGYEEAVNDYPFIRSKGGGPSLVRANANFVRRRVGADGLLPMGRATLTLSGAASASDAGEPGAYTQAAQGGARQRDQDLSFSSSLRLDAGGGTVLNITPSVRFTTQRWHDPALIVDGTVLDSRYDNRSVALMAGCDLAVARGVRLFPGVDIGYARLESAELRGAPRRWTTAAFVAAELTPLDALRLYPALRVEALRDQPDGRALDVATPSLGLHATLSPGRLMLRAQVAKGFRAPTFNQLYWLQGGNATLKPEHAWVMDAGVRWTPDGALPSLDVTVFRHDITDKIVWMPGAGLWWSPRNIQHVVSQGVECSAGGALWSGALTWRMGAQYTDARKVNVSFAGDATAGKRLVYVPALSGSMQLDMPVTSWLHASIREQVTGRRPYTEDNDPRRTLPAFAVTDLALSVGFPLAGTRIGVKSEILNVFNTSYEIIALFPMPQRQLRITLSTSLASTEEPAP